MKLWRPRPTPPEATARRPLTGLDRKRAVEEAVPLQVEIAGQWAWRILAVVAVVVVFGLLIVSLREIVVPLLLALLLAGLLAPFKSFLIRHRWPRWLAVLTALLAAAVVAAGLVFVVVLVVRHGLPDLEKQSVSAYANFKSFLAAPPFNIDKKQYATYFAQISAAVQKDSGMLVNGALSVGSTAGKVLTGTLLTIFATVFLVLDGKRIWDWAVRLFPRRARLAVAGAGAAGWVTLTAYIRVQLFVAAVDAVFIGVGAFVLHLPLSIAIAIIVFLASFVPVVGAVVSGALAVFIALVYEGPFVALIMLIVVLAVHIIEGNFLHPFITGSAVKVHPLAIVFAVAAGGYIAGIPGALFAVPTVAVANVVILYLVRGTWRGVAPSESKDVVSSE
jgi:predicted PurR-regulated permease PerM